MFFCAFFGFLVYFFCLSGAWAWDFELGACGWELKFQEFLSMPCSCLACLAGLAWLAWPAWQAKASQAKPRFEVYQPSPSFRIGFGVWGLGLGVQIKV